MIIMVRALTMDITAIVVMNGLILSLPIKFPLTYPIIIETKIAINIEMKIGILIVMHIAAIAPLIAAVDPTERSMPPEDITNDIPIATIRFNDA